MLRRSWGRGAVWAACALALVAFAGAGSASAAPAAGRAPGPQAQPGGGTGAPFVPRHSGVGGIVPSQRNPHGGLSTACPCGSGNLSYHGGSVMRTNTTYAIYWLPNGWSFNGNSANYTATINQFLADVAHDSSLRSNVYGALSQYYDTVGGGTHNVAYNSTFGGYAVDTNPFPVSGCDDSLDSVCLLDSQLRAEVQSVVQAQGWPQNGSALYFLFTPNGVGSCFDDLSGCAYHDYCAYHGSFLTASGEILYTNEPWTSQNTPLGQLGCDTGQYPNASDADPTINVMSHEHNEAITDPNVNQPDASHLPAWYDSAGYENGDKCAWTFGTVLGSAGHEYNQTINGRHYLLQEEYNNAASNCISTLPALAPTVSAFSPSSGNAGTSVTISGSGFGGVTSVAFNGVAASFSVNSGMQLTATVPAGATTGLISVTTGAGTGRSATSFTVASSAPTISGFTPTSGPVGTVVTINGTNFTGATHVKFNGLEAASFTVVSPTQVTATVPSGATTGLVMVKTPYGRADSSAAFTVTAAPTITGLNPTSGPVGTFVKIVGSNFTGATSVRFHGVSASFTVVAPWKITTTVPAGVSLGAGPVTVVTSGGTATASSPFTVT